MSHARKNVIYFCVVAFIDNVTLRVKGFRGKTSTHVVQNAFAKHPHVTQNALDRLHLIRLEMFFSLTYSQIIAQNFRQLNVNFFHLNFMKTGHELNCCVFISRECIFIDKFLTST